MDMERKYPTREVDGVDVPQMGIKELIKQLGRLLRQWKAIASRIPHPRKSRRVRLWSLFSAILCIHAFI